MVLVWLSHPQNRLTVYISLGEPKKSGQYLGSDMPLATASTLITSYPKLITAYGATANMSVLSTPSLRPWQVTGELQVEEGSNAGLMDMYTLAASEMKKSARTRNERFLRKSQRDSNGRGGVYGSYMCQELVQRENLLFRKLTCRFVPMPRWLEIKHVAQ
jgi:hypothetical protein